MEVEHLRGQFSDMMEERDFLRGGAGGESEGEGGDEARVAHLKGNIFDVSRSIVGVAPHAITSRSMAPHPTTT